MQYKDRMDFVFENELLIARAVSMGEIEHYEYIRLAKQLDNIKVVNSDIARKYITEFRKSFQEALKTCT